MTRQDKFAERLCARPVPADIKWSELKWFLERLGFAYMRNTGSRRKFYHSERNVLISCHEPHPSPNVDKGCVQDVVQTLRDNGFID